MGAIVVSTTLAIPFESPVAVFSTFQFGGESVSVYSTWHAAPGATVLLESPFPASQVWDRLPRDFQERVIRDGLRLYCIDAKTKVRLSWETCGIASCEALLIAGPRFSGAPNGAVNVGRVATQISLPPRPPAAQ